MDIPAGSLVQGCPPRAGADSLRAASRVWFCGAVAGHVWR